MQIHLKAGHEWRFEELPDDSIALDGAVQGPRLDPVTRRYSFDHHAGCLRLVTSATCRQVFDAILLGLEPEGMNVFVNDLDGDTVLSVWLLRHASRWRTAETARRVRPLVECVAAVDAHGPAYPVDDPAFSRTFYDEVLGPLNQERGDGYPAGIESALWDALARLEQWWEDGLPPRVPPPARDIDARFTNEGSWVLAELDAGAGERVPAVAASLYANGYDRIVIGAPAPGGVWRYLIARRSDLVGGFPLDKIYAALNERERAARGHDLGPGQTWGGGSSVGGGPRHGSRLAPKDVRPAVSAVLLKI
jgi:hypothetical protein